MVIACNTAHLLAPAIEERLGIRIVSLIEHTANEAKRRGITCLGILASPTTIRSKLYEQPLRSIGINVIVPDSPQIEIVERAIRSVLAGMPPVKHRQALETVIDSLKQRGAEAILLGCTELSVLLPRQKPDRLDPLHIITTKLFEDTQ